MPWVIDTSAKVRGNSFQEDTFTNWWKSEESFNWRLHEEPGELNRSEPTTRGVRRNDYRLQWPDARCWCPASCGRGRGIGAR